MAKLAHVPVVLRRVGPWRMLRRVLHQMNEDDVYNLAASNAFAWLFALFPFLIILLTLVPYLPEEMRNAARQNITEYVTGWLPKQSVDAIQQNLPMVLDRPRGGLMSVGILLTLWAASGGMSTTMRAINTCYDVPRPRPIYKHRPLAIAITILVVVLMMSVILLLPVGSVIMNSVIKYSPEIATKVIVIDLARWSLAVMAMFGVLSLIYYFGPSVSMRFRMVTPGAAFVVIAWIVLGLGFRFYIQNFAQYDKMYGALAGVVILMMVLYLGAVILLVGAEINSEIDLEMYRIDKARADIRLDYEPPPPSY